MRISIVTATWNSAATLADTLRSVNVQDHRDVEHIIIDGGSTDATLSIIRELGERITTVVSEPDEGIYDAMNKGIARAIGDIVGLLNSDDFYASPTVLSRVDAAFADPEVDIVYADLCYVAQDDASRVVRYWRSNPFRAGLFSQGWAPPHPTVFLRRSVYERFGNFDLRFPVAADMELMARLLEVHRLRAQYVPEVFVHMRTGGASNRSLQGIFQQNREIWRALHEHGLAASPATFLLRKLLSRGGQFITRPS